VADPATYRPAQGEIPESPGVYKFRDAQRRVVYVGKAKNLRARLSSYFQDLANLHPRTQAMVTTAASVEWTVVATEVEALQLEYAWIKEFDPRFNVRYRDDKSYPSLAVTVGEEIPRVQVMRGPKRKGVRYFGPYAHAWAIRETLDLLLRVFPVRSCSAGVFRRAAQTGRPCLLGYIDKCSAPCVGRVSPEEHRAIVDDFCAFMAGQTTTYVRRLEKAMREASAALEFERAARLRDDIKALERALERNAIVLGDGTDADVIALAEDPLEAAVQIFHVRGGRVRGQRGWVVDRVEDVTTGELVERFLQQLYGTIDESGADGVPREILVPELPPDMTAMDAWLAERHGGRVELRVPRRGDKRALLDTVAKNATHALALHKTRRASDLTARGAALQELADVLGLDTAPLRIEAYDISNLQGTNVVASMVVFEDGLPRKSEYRRFAIRGGVTDPADMAVDDTAAMREVITRRFRRYLREREAAREDARAARADGDTATSRGEAATGTLALGPEDEDADEVVRGGIDPTTGKPRKFSYAPQLVVVDGGAPQVDAAVVALAGLELGPGSPGGVAVVGLAKRLEEVWLPGEDDPLVLSRTSEALYLLQRVRDEAHRFAITYHRQRRSKAMTASALDGITGLGEARRKALLERFGSLKALRAATAEQIAEVPGIGPATAAAVVAALASRRQGAAINTATGEIIDEDAQDRSGRENPEEPT
jgi:excinuclease ABC subunit C